MKMQHILSDEEFIEYQKIRKRYEQLERYKDDFIESCKKYAKEHPPPCETPGDWYCGSCVLSTLGVAPYDFDLPHCCPLGRYMEYAK